MAGRISAPNMSNAPQELGARISSCTFCDSVSKKFEVAKVSPDLESLYLEHLGKYHGLVK